MTSSLGPVAVDARQLGLTLEPAAATCAVLVASAQTGPNRCGGEVAAAAEVLYQRGRETGWCSSAAGTPPVSRLLGRSPPPTVPSWPIGASVAPKRSPGAPGTARGAGAGAGHRVGRRLPAEQPVGRRHLQARPSPRPRPPPRRAGPRPRLGLRALAVLARPGGLRANQAPRPAMARPTAESRAV